ncbi:MAG: hypothetical protein ACLPKB_13560 [Xanthobacteraceae bacterium]
MKTLHLGTVPYPILHPLLSQECNTSSAKLGSNGNVRGEKFSAPGSWGIPIALRLLAQRQTRELSTHELFELYARSY